MQLAIRFDRYLIDDTLPVDEGWIGDYGQTALVDLDRDGDLDFVVGRKASPSRGIEGILYWYEYQAPDRWVRHVLGRGSLSDVGACALDVDGDGWPDLAVGGVWYRNPGNPREQEFERYVFDERAANAHDVVAADINGDGRPEIVTLGDGPNGLSWYRIPADPTGPWERHFVAPGVHGAIAPAGIADIDVDGDLDIVCADTWYENHDGKGLDWVPHRNIPFGRVGPFGMCVRCVVIDVDGDGRDEVVMADADIEDSRIAILRNVDGRGGCWERRDLPQSFPYGSIHALAVADLNGDGQLEILVAEQEELLPAGRTDPRWVLWENLGGGEFREQTLLDCALGGHEFQVGDVDGDGALDVCSKLWGIGGWHAGRGKLHADFLHNRCLRAPVER